MINDNYSPVRSLSKEAVQVIRLIIAGIVAAVLLNF